MQGVELKDDGIHCPDYSFYLAENLITIDHQSQQATLKSFCFSQEEQVEVAKTALSISQKLKILMAYFPLKRQVMRLAPILKILNLQVSLKR